MIIKLIKRWKEVKALINADEFFLTVTNTEPSIEPWHAPIKYNYFSNTSRNLFYTFVKDYVINKLNNK